MTSSDRTVWHYRDTGTGRPLVLLHGIGMSHAAWNPVTPYLRETRRVIAFDVAGFGLTPPLPRGTLPTITNLVAALARSLHSMGIETPVDMAGSSLGGAMALEAARCGVARSAVAISPPGLWQTHAARHVQYVFRVLRSVAGNFPKLLKTTLRVPLLREIALTVPLSPGSRHMPTSDALRAVDDLAGSAAFEETFDNTRAPFSGRDIAVPVTVVFGGRDWILTKGSRQRRGLPAHTHWITKPGWGHVPMWIDPAGVAQVIADGTC
jgi:pimeloyl-ACP methyl ester carboxylesterase